VRDRRTMRYRPTQRREQTSGTGGLVRMGLGNFLFGWLRSAPLDVCPACGRKVRGHDVRTLARERFTPNVSGIESHFARGDYAGAAALDDRGVMGDQLLHQLVRCGERVALVTTEDPIGFGREARVRRVSVLDGIAANLAWSCAR
jgi:hypothetical protein